MSEKKQEIGRFFKHSYIYALGNIINRVGAFLLLPIYTNYLSPSEYGALELFYGISAVIVGFLSVGLAHATLRFYFEYDDLSDRRAVVTTNLIASSMITIIGVTLVGIWYKEISNLVFGHQEYAMGVLVILVTLVLEMSSQICLAYIRAIEKSLFFVYIAIAKLVVQVALNIYFVIFLEWDVVGILYGNAVSVFLGWIILFYFTVKECGFKFDTKKLKTVLLYSFPFLLGTITSLISSNVDKFGLNYFDALSAVGIYMLAVKFGQTLEQLIGEPFNRSYGSFRFSIMKNKNAPEIQSLIVKYLFIGIVFFSLCMSLFIGDLLKIMSDESYWPASNIVPIILLSSIIKVMNYPCQTGILIAKKTKYFFYFGIITSTVSVTFNLSLIPILGIYGACISLIVTDIIAIILMHKTSQKYFNVDYQYTKLLKAFGVALTIYGIHFFTPISNWYLSVVYHIALTLLYAVILLKTPWCFDFEEKEQIYGRLYQLTKIKAFKSLNAGGTQ